MKKVFAILMVVSVIGAMIGCSGGEAKEGETAGTTATAPATTAEPTK